MRQAHMIETNQASEHNFVIKGRESLDKGDLSTAIEYYKKAHDPEAIDEPEARNMLIEAHALLSRKHFLEALEHFEEALIMGTDVQRRQAIEGISRIAEFRSKLSSLRQKLKKSLDQVGVPLKELGLALVSKSENVVLITQESLEKLPSHLVKGTKISRLPQHLTEIQPPLSSSKCIPFADEEDIKYIAEVANELRKSLSVSK